MRLIYVSRSLVSESQQHQAIRDIVTKAIANNRIVDVTGMLLASPNAFLQVLEGPSSGVRAIFDAVCLDNRHTEVKVIELISSPARLFRDWNMSVRTAAEDSDLTDPALEPEKALLLLGAGTSGKPSSQGGSL